MMIYLTNFWIARRAADGSFNIRRLAPRCQAGMGMAGPGATDLRYLSVRVRTHLGMQDAP